MSGTGRGKGECAGGAFEPLQAKASFGRYELLESAVPTLIRYATSPHCAQSRDGNSRLILTHRSVCTPSDPPLRTQFGSD